ncbi:MAG: hypothetical protein WC867_01285 [Candidatus Pacearchaeota archaeon]|jgi:hypothetical protein
MGLSEIKPEHRIFFLRYFIEEIFATSYEEFRLDSGIEKIPYKERTYNKEGFDANLENNNEETDPETLQKSDFIIIQKNDLPKNLNETKSQTKNIGELRKSIVLRQKYPSTNNFSKGRQIITNPIQNLKKETPKQTIIEPPKNQPIEIKEKDPKIKSDFESHLENIQEKSTKESPKKEYFVPNRNQGLRQRPVRKIFHPNRNFQQTNANPITPQENLPQQNIQPAQQPAQQPVMQPIIIQMPQYPNQPMYPNMQGQNPQYPNQPMYPNMQGQMQPNQNQGNMNTSNISEGGYEQSIAGAGPEKLSKNLSTEPAKKIIPLQMNIPSMPIPQQQKEIKIIAPPVPNFTGTESGLKKIEFLMKDAAVQLIECPGPGKNINIKRHNKMMATKVILSQNQIMEIVNEYSNQARIPLVGGILKAAVGNSVISAVVSEFVGARFMINKLTPYSILYGKN